MSKKNKKKFKKKFKAQLIQQMQSMQKGNVQDKPEVEVDLNPINKSDQEKSKWNVSESKISEKIKEPEKPQTNKDEMIVKTDLFKVGWVFGLTIVLLTALTIINYQTTWLDSFSDVIARFSHIIK